MKKKNVIDELIRHELMTLNDILAVLIKKGLVAKDGYLTESGAWSWFFDAPEAEKRDVLVALGYEL